MEGFMNEKKSENADTISKKRERFIRIAERRVNYVLDNLERLGNCSNRRNYEYYEDDIRKIFNEIEKKTKEIKAVFQEVPKGKKQFKL